MMDLAHLLLVTLGVTASLRYVFRGRLQRDLPKVVLIAILTILHGVVPLVTSPMNLGPRFSISAHEWASAYGLYSLAALLAGLLLAEVWTPGVLQVGVSSGSRGKPASDREALKKKLFWLTLLLGLIGLGAYFVSHNLSFQQFISGSRFTYRHQRSRGIMWVGLYLTHLLFIPPFIGAQLNKTYRRGALILAFVTAVLFFFVFFKGTRHMALGVLLAYMFGWIYRSYVSRTRLLAVVVILLIVGFAGVSLYRVRAFVDLTDPGPEEVAAAVEYAFSPAGVKNALTRDPLNYHKHLVGAVASFPDKHPYFWGAGYLRILLFPLPGNLKPEHPNRVYAQVVYPDVYDLSMEPVHPPSLFGNAYINLMGWPGLIAVFCIGLGFGWLVYLVSVNLTWQIALGSHVGWLLILGPRGSPYELTIMCIFLIVVVWGLSTMLRIRYL